VADIDIGKNHTGVPSDEIVVVAVRSHLEPSFLVLLPNLAKLEPATGVNHRQVIVPNLSQPELALGQILPVVHENLLLLVKELPVLHDSLPVRCLDIVPTKE
jgi:hypothetical protein